MSQPTTYIFYHDECVAAISDYYDFLTSLYLDESSVLRPPPGGWSEITPETMHGLGKSDTVINLLRHLPYIRTDGERIQAAPWVEFANWADTPCASDEDGENARICSEPPEYVESDSIPAHVIGLTACESAELGGYFLLDTELGVVHWVGCYGELKDEQSLDDDSTLIRPILFDEDTATWDEDDEEAEWRGDSPAWPVAEFFEVLKGQFRKLSFVALDCMRVQDIYTPSGPGKDGYIETVQGVYRQHGWPDVDRYRKSDCLQAVEDALQERYPGEFF
ncbi:hypothetical protein PFICI_03670 [Pestalotiopsis fici W106-1]|uniref:Uncharacterized protein n=1 Tax=Pestalotiopsis fici (strain W106-1 / CGMCC3.15140) TaxID=1229662 RepID=W3XI01_PESFW|nr:uncharacterized protein PFICI_03670 [Pestalotiopsis fici W106-1]ETS85645.1 hypothetical protein PFICI_03670 [Pestalotiopsis fici W106-1]